MKKILTLLVCTVLIFSACNKNKKFNKTLDGTWISTSVDGQSVAAKDATKLTFSKDGKDDGSVTVEDYKNDTLQDRATGTYKITDKGKTLTINANTGGIGVTLVGKISNSSKSKFTSSETITIPFFGSATQVVEYTKQ